MKHIFLTTVLLGLTVVSAAQERQLLTLEEALSITLEHNPSMQAAAHEERAAEQERRAAIGLRMPQINVAGAYAYMGKDIGFDFNDMKPYAQGVLSQIGSKLPPDLLPFIGQLTAPIMEIGRASCRERV